MIFYRPVESQRFFSKGIRYDAINWKDCKAIVTAFKTRMEDWYLRPAEELRKASWDYSFALMAINCLLIDALSQYHYGEYSSSRGLFKKYVRRKLPPFKAALPTMIQMRPERRTRRSRKSSSTKLKPVKKKYFKSFADILYHCYRCGILHEAHIAGCGGLAGLGAKMVDVDPDVCTQYRNGSECPTIRIDPGVVFDELKAVFDRYIGELLNPNSKFDARRRKFKRKFTTAIGIDISHAI